MEQDGRGILGATAGMPSLVVRAHLVVQRPVYGAALLVGRQKGWAGLEGYFSVALAFDLMKTHSRGRSLVLYQTYALLGQRDGKAKPTLLSR